MSRDDGFAVMDISTDYVNDIKWRKLQRHAPDHLCAAFMAYTATVAESWKAGHRVTIEEAWPVLLPFDRAAVEALIHVGFLDRRGTIPPKPWRGWFDKARQRRDKTRERWRRYNVNRDVDTASLPRGTNAATATSVRQSVSPSDKGIQGVSPLDEQPRRPRLVDPEKTA